LDAEPVNVPTFVCPRQQRPKTTIKTTNYDNGSWTGRGGPNADLMSCRWLIRTVYVYDGLLDLGSGSVCTHWSVVVVHWSWAVFAHILVCSASPRPCHLSSTIVIVICGRKRTVRMRAAREIRSRENRVLQKADVLSRIGHGEGPRFERFEITDCWSSEVKYPPCPSGTMSRADGMWGVQVLPRLGLGRPSSKASELRQ
jgi:hypothetical protein